MVSQSGFQSVDCPSADGTYGETSVIVDIMSQGISGCGRSVPAKDSLVSAAEETTEEELSRFIQLCEAGRFYDQMMEHFGIPSAQRGRFKEKIFINVMFGDPKRSRHSREWKFFESAFPHMAQLISTSSAFGVTEALLTSYSGSSRP
jgi:hypothetical protein